MDILHTSIVQQTPDSPRHRKAKDKNANVDLKTKTKVISEEEQILLIPLLSVA